MIFIRFQSLRHTLHSNGVDEPIVVYNDASITNKNWLYADHLGSIVALANTTGAATANYTYSAEGKQGGSTASRFGYTGQQNLSGLGVQYYKARMYSADLGRFIQTDPISMADDMNLYAYVGNNAVNRVDPSGNWGIYEAVVGSATLGGGKSTAIGDYKIYDAPNYKCTGIFTTISNDIGFALGAGIQVGFFKGNQDELFSGKGVSTTYGAGIASVSINYSNNKFAGISIGIGDGAPIGRSISFSNTKLEPDYKLYSNNSSSISSKSCRN
jgi:RHS repeat-associated protein